MPTSRRGDTSRASEERRRIARLLRISGTPQTEAWQAHDPPLSIFTRFLKFGCLAWGGPAAQIAMISKECVEEERWVSPETFKKTLAVYQVLPGPEAHELCVYFGRLRGGKLGGFLAGLGFMLPGFLLMLGLSILYVEAESGRAPRRGLLRAEGGRRRDRRPGPRSPQPQLHHRRSARSDRRRRLRAHPVRRRQLRHRPARRRACSTSSGRTPARWIGRAHSFSLGLPAVLVFLAGAVTFSLTAEIFWEGLKAGLVTFGGAFTVIPYLNDVAVEGKHWLTESQFVDGLAHERRPAGPADHLLDVRRLHRRRARRRTRDDARHLHPGLRLSDLLPPPARRHRRERAPASLPARRRGRGDRADRRRHRRHRRHERRRRADSDCSPSAASSS